MTEAMRATLACLAPNCDRGMVEVRRPRLVALVALLLAVAGCGGSDGDSSPEDDSSPDAEYGTSLTIAASGIMGLDRFYHGRVRSQAKECSLGRRVLLLERRPGRDRELGAARSGAAPVDRDAVEQDPENDWPVFIFQQIELRRGARIYAKAPREERSGSVCRADRSKVLLHGITNE